jgi:hypothetical protein
VHGHADSNRPLLAGDLNAFLIDAITSLVIRNHAFTGEDFASTASLREFGVNALSAL